MSQKSNRLIKIYSLLKQRPVTIEILKEWAAKNNVEISARTFYRDLQVLENALLTDEEEITVTKGEKNKKTWKIEYKGDDKITEFDINSYLLFRNFMSLPLVKSRRSSLERLQEIFYKTYSKSRFEDFAAYAERQISASFFGQFRYEEGFKKTLDDLLWSVRARRMVRVDRIDFDITSVPQNIAFPMEIFPLKILYHHGIVHLGGIVKSTGKIIVLALPQISGYKLTNEGFKLGKRLEFFESEMKKRFGITENIDENIYDIALEFSEALGDFLITESWHPTQIFEKLPDGNYLMRLHCGINRELVGWIFMWMTNIRVREPQILKDIVIEKHREVLTDYETEKPLVSNNSFRAR